MNLGLTGPLNPLRPGNAALGHSPLGRRPRWAGRRPGRGSFVAAAEPADRGGRGGLLAAGAPSPFILPLPPAPPPRPGARLCTFLLGRRARPGAAAWAAGASLSSPEAGDAPAPPPPQGLRLTRAGRGLRRRGRRPWRWALRGARAKVGIPARTRCQGEAKGDLGSGSAAAGEKTRA